ERFGGFLVDFPDVCAIEFEPIIRLQHIKRTRIGFAGGTADAVCVVFYDKQHWQFLLLRETNCLVKVALSCCRIADRGENGGVFSIELDAPRNSAAREKL